MGKIMKKNILIIQTDQQSKGTLGCYGGLEVETPHIDALCLKGIKFNHFYTPSAVCTPSRGCLVTGRYPHTHGAYRNDVALNKDEVTFAQILKEQGYTTGYIGKWHLADKSYPGWMTTEESMGFEQCEWMFNASHDKEVIEKVGEKPQFSVQVTGKKPYMTDWLVDKTIELVQQNHKQPFCYMLSIPDPHQPYSVRAPYDTMFDPNKVHIPRSFYQETLPDWAEEDEWGRHSYFPIDMPEREQKFRQMKAQYLGEVKCIDDNIGRIVTCLKNKGILEETLIIFTSDHGDYMGEHGLQGKNNLYDSVYNIPLIMSCPTLFKESQTINAYMSVVDFQSTLLALMGIAPSGKEQGKDYTPILRGEEKQWEDEVYIHPNDVPRVGIITPDYELAYVGKGWERERVFQDHILFDRKHDPDQLHNLFHEEAYQEVIQCLTHKIINHCKCSGIPEEHLPQVLKQYFHD